MTPSLPTTPPPPTSTTPPTLGQTISTAHDRTVTAAPDFGLAAPAPPTPAAPPIPDSAPPAPSAATADALTPSPALDSMASAGRAAYTSGRTTRTPVAGEKAAGTPDVARPDAEVQLARAYLLRVAEPPAPALTCLVAAYGPVRAAALVRAGEVPADVQSETEARRTHDRAAADLARAEVAGARLVTPEDDEWPHWPFAAFALAAARGIPWAVPPLALWVRGPARLDDLSSHAVAIVGSRAATSYGQHVATELGYELATRGATVISGAAYGIDGAAHRGALTAEGTTVAVLACGVDRGYPSGHTALLDRIATTGAVISEYAPGTPPARHRFLIRNRLIAALADGTVVVEAGFRSGAKNTATSARELGRVVMAVPGPITSAMSRGTNQLIRDTTATAVTTPTEVTESLGHLTTTALYPTPEPPRPTDRLDATELRIHEALRPRIAHTAEWVAHEAGVPLARVRAALPMLEHLGLVRRTPAGWHLAPTPPPKPATSTTNPPPATQPITAPTSSPTTTSSLATQPVTAPTSSPTITPPGATPPAAIPPATSPPATSPPATFTVPPNTTSPMVALPATTSPTTSAADPATPAAPNADLMASALDLDVGPADRPAPPAVPAAAQPGTDTRTPASSHAGSATIAAAPATSPDPAEATLVAASATVTTATTAGTAQQQCRDDHDHQNCRPRSQACDPRQF